MPGKYTICLDPNVQPVQHAQGKVPMESWTEIEENPQEMVDQQVIAPVSQPTDWDPLHLHGHLWPKQSHHLRVLLGITPDEISHWLNCATALSKLMQNKDFWSIHHNEGSSYLTKLTCLFLRIPFGLKIRCISDLNGPDKLTGILAIHDDMCIEILSRGTQQQFNPIHESSNPEWASFLQQYMHY